MRHSSIYSIAIYGDLGHYHRSYFTANRGKSHFSVYIRENDKHTSVNYYRSFADRWRFWRNPRDDSGNPGIYDGQDHYCTSISIIFCQKIRRND
ncbi:hypothetical protein D3C80_1797110 [compost metagenome]